jgi:hypothetical protein
MPPRKRADKKSIIFCSFHMHLTVTLAEWKNLPHFERNLCERDLTMSAFTHGIGRPAPGGQREAGLNSKNRGAARVIKPHKTTDKGWENEKDAFVSRDWRSGPGLCSLGSFCGHA